MLLILLPAILLTLLLISPPGRSPDTLHQIVDRDRDLLVASVQELVRIPSVAGEPEPGAPFGPGSRDALTGALGIAGRLGFATTNLDNYAGFAEFGNGNNYVGILGHVDKVPEGENWTHPPFSGEIHDGKIYIRGALDDKGPALAALFGARPVEHDSRNRIRKEFLAASESSFDNGNVISSHCRVFYPQRAEKPFREYPTVPEFQRQSQALTPPWGAGWRKGEIR